MFDQIVMNNIIFLKQIFIASDNDGGEMIHNVGFWARNEVGTLAKALEVFIVSITQFLNYCTIY